MTLSPARPGGNERYLSGGENVPPAGERDVFTASGRQPQYTVEQHDERERFNAFA